MHDASPPDDGTEQHHIDRREASTPTTLPLSRRRYLQALGASGVAGTAIASGPAAGQSSPQTGSGGSHVGVDDGFADASWLESSDVEVLTVAEPTRAALEEAITTSGSRVVAFETSGTIDLGGEPLVVTEPKCWIAGQTAPSPGITLVGGLFQVDANDVVVQHVRSRVGPGTEGDVQGNDSMNSQDGTQNVVFDHCTAS